MDFVAVDVETANRDKSSICQIGWTVVRNGTISSSDALLIDPETYFDPFFVSIHGITEDAVRGSPKFADVKQKFHELMNNLPVISYGLFDKAAFDLANNADVDTPFVTNSNWINGQKIVRRAWPEHFKNAWRLSFVASTLSLDLQAHDAGSDARVLAEVILLASEKLEMSFGELVARAEQPVTLKKSTKKPYYQSLRMQGNSNGPLSGQNICFTGSLGISRREAAELVNGLGAAISTGVTKKTTILVIGTQNSPMITDGKSSKHKRAEDLIHDGCGIEILDENQFLQVLGYRK